MTGLYVNIIIEFNHWEGIVRKMQIVLGVAQ